MAIYSTFFVAAPEALLAGFPGWKLPLDKPVQREVTNFFGTKQFIQTREPLWEDIVPGEELEPEFVVEEIKGDYAEYLENTASRVRSHGATLVFERPNQCRSRSARRAHGR
jgi:hypothetical protein